MLPPKEVKLPGLNILGKISLQDDGKKRIK